MSNPVQVITTTPPPKRSADFDNTTMYESEQACPALQHFAEKEDQDAWTKGVMSALYTLYASLTGMGDEEILTGITTDFVARVDQAMAANAEEILKHLPNVLEYMSTGGDDDGYKAGVACGFASAFLAANETTPPAEDISALDEPEEMESFSNEGDGVPVESTPINDTVGLSYILTRLYGMGMDLDTIIIKPYIYPTQAEGEPVQVGLKIMGSLGPDPEFDRVATINNMFKSVGGKDIRITTQREQLWYEYTL
jgi:hypothetical protein